MSVIDLREQDVRADQRTRNGADRDGTEPDIGDLRYVEPSTPGISRIRCGRGFRYCTPTGTPLRSRGELDRIRALAVPPAWQEVWICPDPDGHIQAVGTDAAGRRQYRYHDRWREQRDRAKFDRVRRLAKRLPAVRAEVAERIEQSGLTRERVLAGALRMLELGAFRVGGEQYAPDDEADGSEGGADGSFGLATLRRDHVRRVRGEVRVSYLAKGGIHRELAVSDPAVHRLVGALLRCRGATITEDLLVYRVGRKWHDVRSDDINAYLKELAGDEFTAKDLRTWNATVLGAVALAGVPERQGGSVRGRKRAVSAACKQVAEHLGNTPTVARQSYIDPRVVHAFEHGRTVAAAVRRATEQGGGGDAIRDAVEPAVIRLLSAGGADGRFPPAPRGTRSAFPNESSRMRVSPEREEPGMPGSESDVADDPNLANSRAVGGRSEGDERDKHSTTGTTESGEFVGRVSGHDETDTGLTGAEARAEAERSK